MFRIYRLSYLGSVLAHPDPLSIFSDGRRPTMAIELPRVSHIIYHQENVDLLAAENCIRSIAAGLWTEDEVIFLDVGGTSNPGILNLIPSLSWRSYVACNTDAPDKKSYTYGLNVIVPRCLGQWIILWRTDYVYQSGYVDQYRAGFERFDYITPAELRIGHEYVTSDFVRQNWSKVQPFDANYWQEHSHRHDCRWFYDTAMFAIKKDVWIKVGGMPHYLWGYGWQFPALDIVVTQAVGSSRRGWIEGYHALHQYHRGSVSKGAHNEELKSLVRHSYERLVAYVGGEVNYARIRRKLKLP
jgi:hypothetical protein